MKKVLAYLSFLSIYALGLLTLIANGLTTIFLAKLLGGTAAFYTLTVVLLGLIVLGVWAPFHLIKRGKK